MDTKQAKEIIACLPEGRTIFRYFKDRYAPALLSYIVGDGMTPSQIKKTPMAKLLNRPVLKNLAANLGGSPLTPMALDSTWPAVPESYLLTLGVWGDHIAGRRDQAWFQTSRPAANLVLQLNFSTKHDRPYDKLLKPDDYHPFSNEYHPINEAGRHTLAWARIDIDLDAGEALIEEIQNDWIRNALQSWRHGWPETNAKPIAMARYLRDVLSPHMRIWDEAILSAAIWFLRSELGVRRIFYHTFESGTRLKQIDGTKPPRSLYTRLPNRFCFRETCVPPSFLIDILEAQRLKLKSRFVMPRFFVLLL
ncbi:MAG: hypothetical protein GY794_21985 [bacterium]|nr:hypothetical protein [bacterium]